MNSNDEKRYIAKLNNLVNKIFGHHNSVPVHCLPWQHGGNMLCPSPEYCYCYRRDAPSKLEGKAVHTTIKVSWLTMAVCYSLTGQITKIYSTGNYARPTPPKV